MPVSKNVLTPYLALARAPVLGLRPSLFGRRKPVPPIEHCIDVMSFSPTTKGAPDTDWLNFAKIILSAFLCSKCKQSVPYLQHAVKTDLERTKIGIRRRLMHEDSEAVAKQLRSYRAYQSHEVTLVEGKNATAVKRPTKRAQRMAREPTRGQPCGNENCQARKHATAVKKTLCIFHIIFAIGQPCVAMKNSGCVSTNL